MLLHGIVHAVRDVVIGPSVTPTINDRTKPSGDRSVNLRVPGAHIGRTAVHEYNRIATTALVAIGKRGSIDQNGLEVAETADHAKKCQTAWRAMSRQRPGPIGPATPSPAPRTSPAIAQPSRRL